VFEGILEAFTIPEVRKRILFTLGAFAIFRFGAWIPVPGVDVVQLQQFFEQANFSIFALGVIPYINASIIMSLLQAVIPRLKELQKQGDEGRRIINRYVRYGTVGLALLQAMGVSYVIVNQGLLLPGESPVLFYFTSIIALTTGTMFLMWLGERITENGIGRGVSMIIMAGILAGYPGLISDAVIQFGEIQYAKRVVRGRVYGGQSTYIPFMVNQGGVIPIIFAAAILTLPQIVLGMPAVQDALAGAPGFIQDLAFSLQGSGWLYLTLYGLLIFFFTYFYSAIVFNPQDLADNLRRWGGFIPGVRPGRPTAEYLERIQSRLLAIGGLFLVIIALLPYVVVNLSGLQIAFALGGTSILIAVGVAVDTIKQIEAHMVERHYESLIRKGAVLGRKL